MHHTVSDPDVVATQPYNRSRAHGLALAGFWKEISPSILIPSTMIFS
jgi:hypothetical protein